MTVLFLVTWVKLSAAAGADIKLKNPLESCRHAESRGEQTNTKQTYKEAKAEQEIQNSSTKKKREINIHLICPKWKVICCSLLRKWE